jgi:hypothetical protein
VTFFEKCYISSISIDDFDYDEVKNGWPAWQITTSHQRCFYYSNSGLLEKKADNHRI